MKLKEAAELAGKPFPAGRAAIKRIGPWELRRRAAGTEEWDVLTHAIGVEPFILLWSHVIEDLHWQVAVQSIVGDSINIKLMPATNTIILFTGDEEFYTYECVPLEGAGVQAGQADEVVLPFGNGEH